MREVTLRVVSNTWLNDSVLEMVLVGDNLNMVSGQFVEVAINGLFLRRPFSVACCKPPYLTIIYKVVGEGTKIMSAAVANATYATLVDLGNTFDLSRSQKPLLMGGGIGVAPMYQLAREFVASGIRPTMLFGYRNASEIFYLEKFRALGDVIIATDDGSFGEAGNAVTVLKKSNIDYDFYYACGPMVMLKYLAKFSTKGQLSLEARMGCGFGACMGCSIMTTKGAKRVCKEGAIFNAEEVIFDD